MLLLLCISFFFVRFLFVSFFRRSFIQWQCDCDCDCNANDWKLQNRLNEIIPIDPIKKFITRSLLNSFSNLRIYCMFISNRLETLFSFFLSFFLWLSWPFHYSDVKLLFSIAISRSSWLSQFEIMSKQLLFIHTYWCIHNTDKTC